MARGRKKTGGTFIQRSRSVGAGQKAAYHHVVGAGKSRVKRQFWGLTQEDADAIAALVFDGIRQGFLKR